MRSSIGSSWWARERAARTVAEFARPAALLVVVTACFTVALSTARALATDLPERPKLEAGRLAADPADRARLEAELRDTETAFARSMADRDHEAFASFLSEEAVFLGQKETLRGKAAVAAAWKRFFEGEAAPFSWAPERAEVLESGSLGLTSGPVRDPEGTVVGTFNSVWRREEGRWRIVFDKGCPPCP